MSSNWFSDAFPRANATCLCIVWPCMCMRCCIWVFGTHRVPGGECWRSDGASESDEGLEGELGWLLSVSNELHCEGIGCFPPKYLIAGHHWGDSGRIIWGYSCVCVFLAGWVFFLSVKESTRPTAFHNQIALTPDYPPFCPFPGANAKLRYQITSGNTMGTFDVEPEVGTIFVAQPLDYEMEQRFQLRLVASDGKWENETLVVVQVVNQNDEAPVFGQTEYHAPVTEELTELPVFVLEVRRHGNKELFGVFDVSVNGSCPEHLVTPEVVVVFGSESLLCQTHMTVPLDNLK